MSDYEYKFNVIYNRALSRYSNTEDTKLSLDFVEFIVEICDGWGYEDSYYYERDALPGRNIFDELFKVIKQSEHTVVVLTPGFKRDCWHKYSRQSAFKKLLDEERDSNLIPLCIGLTEKDLPDELCINNVLMFHCEDVWNESERKTEWIKCKNSLRKLQRVFKENRSVTFINDNQEISPSMQETGDNTLRTERAGTCVTQPDDDTDGPEPVHRRALAKCSKQFRDDLHTKEVLDEMDSHLLFPTTTIRDIREMTTTSDKNRRIVELVQTLTVEKYEIFKDCLREVDQQFLVDALETAENKITNPLPKQAPPELHRACSLSFEQSPYGVDFVDNLAAQALCYMDVGSQVKCKDCRKVSDANDVQHLKVTCPYYTNTLTEEGVDSTDEGGDGKLEVNLSDIDTPSVDTASVDTPTLDTPTLGVANGTLGKLEVDPSEKDTPSVDTASLDTPTVGVANGTQVQPSVSKSGVLHASTLPVVSVRGQNGTVSSEAGDIIPMTRELSTAPQAVVNLQDITKPTQTPVSLQTGPSVSLPPRKVHAKPNNTVEETELKSVATVNNASNGQSSGDKSGNELERKNKSENGTRAPIAQEPVIKKLTSVNVQTQSAQVKSQKPVMAQLNETKEDLKNIPNMAGDAKSHENIKPNMTDEAKIKSSPEREQNSHLQQQQSISKDQDLSVDGHDHMSITQIHSNMPASLSLDSLNSDSGYQSMKNTPSPAGDMARSIVENQDPNSVPKVQSEDKTSQNAEIISTPEKSPVSPVIDTVNKSVSTYTKEETSKKVQLVSPLVRGERSDPEGANTMYSVSEKSGVQEMSLTAKVIGSFCSFYDYWSRPELAFK